MKCSYQPASDEYIPAETTRKYAAGDICTVAESIQIPFLQIFKETRQRLTQKSASGVGSMGAATVPSSEAGRTKESVKTSSPTHSRRASVASSRLLSVNHRDSAAYDRPCLLIGSHKPKTRFAKVFLLATFRNIPMDKMPTVVQCFSVAIFPNLGMDDTNPDGHIHAFPDWPQNKKSWLVARRVTTERVITGRWYHKASTGFPEGRRCSKLDRSQREKLYIIAEDRLTRWTNICEDIGNLDMYEQEFYVSFSLDALEEAMLTGMFQLC